VTAMRTISVTVPHLERPCRSCRVATERRLPAEGSAGEVRAGGGTTTDDQEPAVPLGLGVDVAVPSDDAASGRASGVPFFRAIPSRNDRTASRTLSAGSLVPGRDNALEGRLDPTFRAARDPLWRDAHRVVPQSTTASITMAKR
jgi:hypothetical protein